VSLRFSIEVDGLPVFDRAFNRIERRIDDMRPVWDAVETVTDELDSEQMRTEGAADSTPFAPLTHPYEEAKAEAGYNFLPIMQRSRKLYFALTRKGAEGRVIEKTATEFTKAITLPYAGIHQRSAKKPRRVMSYNTEARKRRIQKAIQQELVAFVRQQGLIVDETNVGDFV
jgi:hypothetical protein